MPLSLKRHEFLNCALKPFVVQVASLFNLFSNSHLGLTLDPWHSRAQCVCKSLGRFAKSAGVSRDRAVGPLTRAQNHTS